MRQKSLSALWAKKPKHENESGWLPLLAHMNDAAEVAARLWDEWLPEKMARRIASGITAGGQMIDTNEARSIFIFLACGHDAGKASPIFQKKYSRHYRTENDELLLRTLKQYFPVKDEYSGKLETRHELVSFEIFMRNNMDESVAVIVGGHHGKPPETGQINNLNSYAPACGFNNKEWLDAQNALFNHAVGYAKLTAEYLAGAKISRSAQVILTGLIILADWIASDENLFPLINIEEYHVDSPARATQAFAELKLPSQWKAEQNWDDLYTRMLGDKTPRPLQEAMLNAVKSTYKPGIFVVEAPMGEGKTEAALAAAEVLAQKAGCRGVYFALPSQATSNAMFSRVLNWVKNFDTDDGLPFSMRLMHGKAEMNKENIKLQEPFRLSQVDVTNDDDEKDINNAFVHTWLSGRKKGILSDFVVGTIDHVLMAGLKQKHLALRHLGLASKVVVIDECHAYDTYMSSYLLAALRWLGAHGVPVVVLSATLPSARRNAVINAYLNKSKIKTQTAYPLITYTDNGEVKQEKVEGEKREKVVNILKTRKEDLPDLLWDALKDGGGCVGVMVNTVNRAQEIYKTLADKFAPGEVEMLHARFMATDRAEKEEDLSNWLGAEEKEKTNRPHRLMVVGTQVLEQSLDIDFDLLITDLCPMDLLIQRIGRLQRHKRKTPRPARFAGAECYVMEAYGEFETGACAIYTEYLLSRTLECLPEKISLPDDIPGLVADVYDGKDALTPIKSTFIVKQEAAESRAKSFQILKPKANNTLVDWLDNAVNDTQKDAQGKSINDSEKIGEAAVREGEESIEVIILQKSGGKIENSGIPPEDDRETAKRTVRLPALFGMKHMIKQTITELETVMIKEGLAAHWNNSKWLKGALCLLFDDEWEATLCGRKLQYSKELGLMEV